MSDMPGNPFATEDALYTEDANNSSVVNATMALVFEQRTANLIALETLLQNAGADIDLEAIEERLGLK